MPVKDAAISKTPPTDDHALADTVHRLAAH
jgi:hypothetical protein